MLCPFCEDKIEIKPDKKHQLREHLVVTLDRKNHFHVHGPTSNKELMTEFIKVIAKESNIEIED